MHEYINTALGIICGAVGWLIVRLVRRVDALEERDETMAKELIFARAAIRRVEEHANLDPYTLPLDT